MVEAANWVVGKDGSGVIKGQMKFCRPVFRAVRKVDADLAKQVFEPSKYAFHPIARKMIENVSFKDFYCVELMGFVRILGLLSSRRHT